jgi:hypothetical protein
MKLVRSLICTKCPINFSRIFIHSDNDNVYFFKSKLFYVVPNFRHLHRSHTLLLRNYLYEGCSSNISYSTYTERARYIEKRYLKKDKIHLLLLVLVLKTHVHNSMSVCALIPITIFFWILSKSF